MPAAASNEVQAEDRSSPVPDSSERKKAREKTEESRAKPKKPRSPLKRGLLVGGALVLVLAGIAYWYHGTFFEETDDAQVDGYISSVSARVAGTVLSVNVEDN